MTDSEGREEVKNQHRPIQNKFENTIRLPFDAGMLISGSLYDTPVTWKVDTGARNTFITFDTYAKIPSKFKPDLKPTKHKFCTANGQEIRCRGEGLMTIKFGGKELYFVVLVGDVTNNLLGEDFIRHFECHLDFRTQEFVIQLGGQKAFECKHRKMLQQSVTTETIYIPAGHESICNFKLKHRSRVSETVHDLGILTPERKFVQSHDLAVAKTLVDTSSSEVYARILNPGDTTVKVYKGTPIALLTPIAEVGKSFTLEDLDENRSKNMFDTASMEMPAHLQDMFENGCKHLTQDQTEQFKEFVIQHHDNFVKPDEVGRTTFGSHKIKLTDNTPIKEAPRRIPLFKRDILDEEVRKLKEKGLIEKSISP